MKTVREVHIYQAQHGQSVVGGGAGGSRVVVEGGGGGTDGLAGSLLPFSSSSDLSSVLGPMGQAADLVHVRISANSFLYNMVQQPQPTPPWTQPANQACCCCWGWTRIATFLTLRWLGGCQVRLLVGGLVQVGQHKITPARFQEMLQVSQTARPLPACLPGSLVCVSRHGGAATDDGGDDVGGGWWCHQAADRVVGPKAAPPHGLYLYRVHYDGDQQHADTHTRAASSSPPPPSPQ